MINAFQINSAIDRDVISVTFSAIKRGGLIFERLASNYYRTNERRAVTLLLLPVDGTCV